MKFPLFVLVGNPFLCEEKRKSILEGLKKEFDQDLPVTLRRAEEEGILGLLSEARTLPFLAPAQAFIIREAQDIGKKDAGPWVEYFRNPLPNSFFIFEADEWDANHPLLEIASSKKQLFFLESEAGRITAPFIREKLKETGKKMSAEALQRLDSRIGDSLTFLDSFLDQVILYTGSRPEITAADIETFDEQFSKLEGEDLLEALAEKNVARALRAMDDLLDVHFRDFPSVLGLLHWQLRRFWEGKRWQEQGIPDREIAARLKLYSSRAASFFKSLNRFSRDELERILEGLYELDRELKRGNAEGRIPIERWLVTSISSR